MRRLAIRLIVFALWLAMMALALEAFAAVYFAALTGRLYYREAHQVAGPAAPFADTPLNNYRLHPLFGWVHRPGREGMNNEGFASPLAYPDSLPPETLRIAILGGSVAANFHAYNQASGELAGQIYRLRPDLSGRPIALINLSKEAYKFPQPQIALLYFLIAGQRVDAVLALDGFNDASSAWVNAGRGIGLAFPGSDLLFNFAQLTQMDLSPAALNLMQGGLYQREAIACRFALCWAAHQAYARWLRSRAAALPGGSDYDPATNLLAIPAGARMAPGRFLDEYEAQWRRSSLILQALARSAGAPLLHVLQPNQYVPTARKFGAAERAVAFAPQPYAEILEPAYRRMIAVETALAGPDARFLDATRLFDAVEEPIYRDNCCHYLPLGDTLLTAAIAAELAPLLPRR